MPDMQYTLPMSDLQGRSAVVIGGSRGIGRALTLELARRGANLTVHGGHNSAEFDRLIAEAKNCGVQARQIVQEFSASALTRQDCSGLETQIRDADILCLCHGPFLQKSLAETTAAEWQSMAVLNFALPGHFVSVALAGMRERGFGRIIVLGGTRTEAVRAFRTNAAYAGAKTALCSLVKSVAAEYARHGITCNAILPGFVQTELQSEEQNELLRNKMPAKKLIQPQEIAHAAAELILNRNYNGVLLNLDAGWNP